MLKVLWLIDGAEGYGVRRATLSLAGALCRSACQVHFVSLNAGSFAAEIRESGYDIDVLSAGPSAITASKGGFFANIWCQFGRQWKWRHRLVEIAQVYQPDWLHVFHNQLLISAGMTARATGRPVYWNLPNTINRRLPFNLQALAYQLFCRWANIRPLGNSRHTSDSLGHRFVNSRVLYHGTDAAHFNPSAGFQPLSRGEVDLEESSPIFAIIARVIPAKAQDRVVEAVIQLLQAGERLQLVIVGGPVDSEFYRCLQARVEAAGVSQAIKLLPPVADPRPWFSLADVIINSRTGPEPFGLTIVEAMLLERPVLACRAGGPAETVLDGATGWLIDDLTVAGYKAGICRALADRAKWCDMGRVGRKRALRDFTIEAVAKKYLEIVEGDRK